MTVAGPTRIWITVSNSHNPQRIALYHRNYRQAVDLTRGFDIPTHPNSTQVFPAAAHAEVARERVSFDAPMHVIPLRGHHVRFVIAEEAYGTLAGIGDDLSCQRPGQQTILQTDMAVGASADNMNRVPVVFLEELY